MIRDACSDQLTDAVGTYIVMIHIITTYVPCYLVFMYQIYFKKQNKNK